MLSRFSWNSTIELRPSTSLGAVLFAIEGMQEVGCDVAIDAIGMIYGKANQGESDLERLTKSGRCRRVLSPT